MNNPAMLLKELHELIKGVQGQYAHGKYPDTSAEAENLGQGFWVHRYPGRLPDQGLKDRPPKGESFTAGTAFFSNTQDAESYSDALATILFTKGGALMFFEQEMYQSTYN